MKDEASDCGFAGHLVVLDVALKIVSGIFDMSQVREYTMPCFDDVLYLRHVSQTVVL